MARREKADPSRQESGLAKFTRHRHLRQRLRRLPRRSATGLPSAALRAGGMTSLRNGLYGSGGAVRGLPALHRRTARIGCATGRGAGAEALRVLALFPRASTACGQREQDVSSGAKAH